MTNENSDIPQQPDYKSKTFYLKEALRLSELKIEQQGRTFDIIEKKTVLLLTLYIATIPYLISQKNIWVEKNGIIIIAWIAISILAVSISFGVSALVPRKGGISGAAPKYLIYFNYDFNAMAMHLLKEEYKDIYATNKEAIRKKRCYLKCSFLLGIGGFILISCWFIALLYVI